MMGSYYGNGAMMNSGAWAWLVVCIGFVFFLLIIVGILFVFMGMIRRKPHSSMMHPGIKDVPGESPMDILKRRYAAGEINKKEFDALKKDLEG